MTMIKPILRFPGSKYRKVKKFIEILDIKEDDIFLDMFGGSAIVGVNVKELTRAKVIINDFDKTFPISPKNAIINMCSFQGLGKNSTPSSEEYFNTRVRNGYWGKFDKYNQVLDTCTITNNDFMDIDVDTPNKIYVDPPYDDIKKLYKGDFTKLQHKRLCEKLSNTAANILISYNDTPYIRELYKDWNISTMYFAYTTGRGTKKKKVDELIITNYML